MMSVPPNVVEALEAEFKVHFSADETASARSALDLYRLILRKLGLVPGQTIGVSGCVFQQLRGAIVRRYGVDVRRLRPNALLRSLVPARRWGKRLIEVAADAGLSPFIPEISPEAKNGADWAAAGCMAAIGLPLLFVAGTASMDVGNRIPMGLAIVPPFAVAIGIGVWVHRGSLREFVSEVPRLSQRRRLCAR